MYPCTNYMNNSFSVAMVEKMPIKILTKMLSVISRWVGKHLPIFSVKWEFSPWYMYMSNLYQTSFWACKHDSGICQICVWQILGYAHHFSQLSVSKPYTIKSDGRTHCPRSFKSVMLIPNKPLTSFVRNYWSIFLQMRSMSCSELMSHTSLFAVYGLINESGKSDMHNPVLSKQKSNIPE